MRIVLKPGGVGLLLLALASLAFLLITGNKSGRSGSSQTPAVPAGEGTSLPVANGGFEEPFTTARFFGEPTAPKAKIGGKMASGWNDNSDWAEVSVQYAEDQTEKREGKSSQRIEVMAVREGHPQMVQQVSLLPGKRYQVQVWVKASRPTQAELFYRFFNEEKTVNSGRVAVSPDWQPLSIELDLRKTSSGSVSGLLVVVLPERGVTYWLDAATVTEIP